ncbi:hypothetical protein ACFOLC_04890 [Lysobacter cavernae]|uniref:Uncharacterized protein n=1 Tax=Lysobacter cavernae TaxID=1685901 RepID=A0ABV7RNA2_9GAMM
MSRHDRIRPLLIGALIVGLSGQWWMASTAEARRPIGLARTAINHPPAPHPHPGPAPHPGPGPAPHPEPGPAPHPPGPGPHPPGPGPHPPGPGPHPPGPPPPPPHPYPYWYDHPWATAAAITTTAAVTAAVIGSMVYSLPPSCTAVVVGNVTYEQCGSTWYQPQYSGSQVTYIVVNSPY